MIVAGRGGGDGIKLVLEAEEAMLLSELADQVDSVLLLGTDDDPPALGRLLPNAYLEDVEASHEFTRYTRDSLVDGKRQAAQQVRDATNVHDGERLVEIELDQVQAWGVADVPHRPAPHPRRASRHRRRGHSRGR